MPKKFCNKGYRLSKKVFQEAKPKILLQKWLQKTEKKNKKIKSNIGSKRLAFLLTVATPAFNLASTNHQHQF
ncbi:hypothetical protein [Wolbachia endosymbiont (group A) of Andrena fulva]|uniref:hypothetical protein n=1 Tax=Wolbachia endosymbiont (group A) of Andrena fulva TaxID=3066191 RepID=UPI003132BAEC